MSNLPACCMDFDIQIEELFFPEKLSEGGREFLRVHGVDRITLSELRRSMTYLGAGIVKIKHRCAMLMDDGSCSIYLNRPIICREFDCRRRTDCACKGLGIIYPYPVSK